MTFRTRFAPSPTGPLHLGHAYSAILAHDMARENGGAFILRIEDIDQGRSRLDWEEQIYDDLTWLGLTWDETVARQSEHLSRYQEALADMWRRGLIFSCSCTRRDIAEAMSAPQEDNLAIGPDGPIYPGTCRHRKTSGDDFSLPNDRALRLNMARALATIEGEELPGFDEHLFQGGARIETNESEYLNSIGDIVLARRDMGTSYHLSVVLDDAAQGITDVVRGEDLFEATKIHVLLQRLMALPPIRYHHHRLIRDDAGKRLAKRDDARAIRTFREDGISPADIRKMLGLLD